MSADRRDRWPAKFSVGVLVENGSHKFGPQGNFDYGLVLVRQRSTNGWGLPAGGGERGEDPVTAGLRELQEEAGIGESQLEGGLKQFRISFYSREDITSIGVIVRGVLKTPIPYEGYAVGNDETNYVKPLTRSDLIGLLRRPEKMYKPDLNAYAIVEWLDFVRSPYDIF